MSDTHEVISAFLDDEPFDANALAVALSEPAGRDLLIDLIALRHLALADGKSSATRWTITSRGALRCARLSPRRRLSWLSSAGISLVRVDVTVAMSVAPPATRVVQAPAAWQDVPDREDAMRIIPWCRVDHPPAAGAAHAQTFNDLQIRLGAYNVSDRRRREAGRRLVQHRPGGHREARDQYFLHRGQPVRRSRSAPPGQLRETTRRPRGDIEVTPIRVVRDAVTFRLRWVRFAALRQQFDQVPLDMQQGLSACRTRISS